MLIKLKPIHNIKFQICKKSYIICAQSTFFKTTQEQIYKALTNMLYYIKKMHQTYSKYIFLITLANFSRINYIETRILMTHNTAMLCYEIMQQQQQQYCKQLFIGNSISSITQYTMQTNYITKIMLNSIYAQYLPNLIIIQLQNAECNNAFFLTICANRKLKMSLKIFYKRCVVNTNLVQKISN
eukprot:TRINITY_DN3642_c0_g1_i4.p1 TRINITY_DN3642_c0_g1~~TRINITY_DN3642_c0_g1_i4.p1  ORF type:complete len:207 (+),score=-25.50 TRINITY_DN3642_c0_g1_i4:71-622(+)